MTRGNLGSGVTIDLLQGRTAESLFVAGEEKGVKNHSDCGMASGLSVL
jgi:hypothetical protein